MTKQRFNPRHFAVLIVFACSMASGCSIERFTISPEIGETSAKTPSQDTVGYRLDYRTFVNEDVRKTREADLRATIETAVRKAGFRVGEAQNGSRALNISVLEHRHEGVPAEWLTGLSGGAIPTWTTREGIYVFGLAIYDDEKLIANHEYRVDSKMFNSILALPVFWVNFFTWRQPHEYLQEAIKATLSEFSDKH